MSISSPLKKIRIIILVTALAGSSNVLAVQQCEPTLQCLTCDSNTGGQQFCTSCADGTGLTTTFPQSCEECEDNCINCVIGQNCTKCYPGYGPDPISKEKCQPCMDPLCIACTTSIIVCDICKSPCYFFKNNRTCGGCADHCTVNKCRVNGASQCDRCDPGYGLTSFNTCASCVDPYCLDCPQRIQTCTQCILGYGFYTDSNLCGACDPNCNITVGCNVSGTCFKCKQGYTTTNNGKCVVSGSNTSPSPGGIGGGTGSGITIQGGKGSVTGAAVTGSGGNGGGTGSGITVSGGKGGLTGVTASQVYNVRPTPSSVRSGGYSTYSTGSGGNDRSTFCPDLIETEIKIGLGIGVPLIVIIIVLLVVVCILSHKYRKLRKRINELNKRSMMTLETTKSTYNTQAALGYQGLNMNDKRQSQYDRIEEHYENYDVNIIDNTRGRNSLYSGYDMPMSVDGLSQRG